MSTTEFCKFLKQSSRLEKEIAKYYLKEKSLSKRLLKVIELVLEVKSAYKLKKISQFEFQYLKHHLLLLFAQNCGSSSEVEIFRKGIKTFIKHRILTKKESYQILDMSPLSRWSGVL